MDSESSPLNGLLAKLLAVDVPKDATVEAVELGFRGALPLLIVVPLFVLLVAAVVALYRSERGTIGPVRRTAAVLLRASLLALLLLLLMRPVLTLVLTREKPRGVVVILDNSQSMKQQD